VHDALFVGVRDDQGTVAAVEHFLEHHHLAGALEPERVDDVERIVEQDLLATAEAAAGPRVLLIEDAHWGDHASFDLCDAALRASAERPLAMIALGRPEVLETFPDLWRDRELQVVRVGTLAKRGGAALVRAALPDATDATVDALVERSGGNAFYLEELVRAVAAGRDAALPETILAMIEARLGSLEPEARRVLRAASVFGVRAWRGGIAALCGRSASEVDGWIDELQRREIVAAARTSRIAGEREVAFRHALVRDAAYAMLTQNDRALGHRLAAEWLERIGDHDPVALAEHWERSGSGARAVPWWTRAAERALDASDVATVIARVERGIRAGAAGADFGALQALLAEAHWWRGENEPAVAAARAALRALEPGSDRWCMAAGALCGPALALGEAGAFRELAPIIQRLLESPTPALVAAATRVASALHMSGDARLGDHVLEIAARAEQVIRESPRVAAAIRWARATSAVAAGDMVGFLESVRATVDSWCAAGHTRAVCHAQNNVAAGLIELGRAGEAEPILRETLATATRLGLARLAATARQHLGCVMSREGRWAEARELLHAALAEVAAQRDRRLEGNTRLELADVALETGEPVEAERQARAALAVYVDGPLVALGRAVLADALRAQGRTEEALVEARDAAARLASLGAAEGAEARIRLSHAQTLAAAGLDEEARAAVATAREALLARAARIEDTSARDTYLTQVREHARTLALDA
jgi:tetratricopeptide (TPR) repeat protein